MKSNFYSTYVNSGAISNVMSNGVTILLLAPARGESEPTDSLTAYASKLAQFISDVKTEKGVVINVTGVANEPQNWTPAEITTVIDNLRADLNSLGLTSVQIIAPESASADSNCDAKLDAMHNDTTCWNAITGIASHSYNMAATSAESSRTFGKQYWITEASDDGNELPDNDNFASTTSARFLNDMNHLVTHWVFFIGFDYSANVSSDQDDATKLMVYNGAGGNIQTNLKYFYLKQLLSTFDVGAVFRQSVSSSESDMAYTYGQKPRINAAAAVNPDGSWGIGIVNDTGIPGSGISTWYGAQNTNVTITVNELVGTGNKNFTLYYSQAGQHFVNGGTVTMTNGTITVAIAAKELICLRSAASGAPSAPSGLSAAAVSSSQINLSWTDNSSNETGFSVQRKTGSGGTYAAIANLTANTTIYNDTGLAGGTTYYYQVAATNASGSSPWSNEANATTTSSGGGSLSGSVAAAAASYNLTTLGTSDWAHWNGTYIHKSSGGGQISNVTQTGGGSYGTFNDTSRSITWTDGTPTGSGTSDHNYIWCNGTANSGWTFTVPASTTSRTLHVVCGGASGATIKITAHLSDGSAADYTDTETSGSIFTKEYTFTYTAASASQTLTITFIHTSSGSPSSDLVAAWLVGAPTVPAAPTGLTAAAGNAQVKLSWNTSSGATSYNVYRGTSTGGEGGTPIVTGITGNSYTNTGLANGTTYYYTVTAVNSAGESGFSNEASATPTSGSLSGSVATAAASYNLTTLGTSDWAHWNGTYIHKSSGGSQISNVTQTGGGTYGTFNDASRSITWTDGTPTGSGTSDHNYIWCNGTANSGWTFTVPASTTSRTLHVVCGGAAGATVKITAHLSDGSATDYTDTETSASVFTKEYTITYNAASASQTLTITFIHTNSGSPSSDLVAAWLP